MKKFMILLALLACFTARSFAQFDSTRNDEPPKSLPKFTPEQDSSYSRAMRLQMPSGSRFELMIRAFAEMIQARRDPRNRTLGEIALDNMRVPAEYYVPSERERLAYAYNIQQSQYVPGIRMPTSGGFTGMQIPLSSIGALLGLVEDVSPTVRYAVEYVATVEMVIYSTQAKIVAVAFHAKQAPGKYSLTWNGRDDVGRLLPSGDYIGEVRIGKESVVRKRIQIP